MLDVIMKNDRLTEYNLINLLHRILVKFSTTDIKKLLKQLIAMGYIKYNSSLINLTEKGKTAIKQKEIRESKSAKLRNDTSYE